MSAKRLIIKPQVGGIVNIFLDNFYTNRKELRKTLEFFEMLLNAHFQFYKNVGGNLLCKD